MAEEFCEGVVFGQCLPRFQECDAAFFAVAVLDVVFGVDEESVEELFLFIDEFYDFWLEFEEHLYVVAGVWHGTTNNKRCAGVVYQNRVDLIDDCEYVFALHEFFGCRTHVVAEVVEAKFVVCTKSYVRIVCLAPCCGVGLVLVDAVNCESLEHI